MVLAGFGVVLEQVGAVGVNSMQRQDVRQKVNADPSPTHTQNWESRSHRPRAGFVWVWVGVPHQLSGGGSKDSAAKSGGVAGNLLSGCWAALDYLSWVAPERLLQHLLWLRFDGRVAA